MPLTEQQVSTILATVMENDTIVRDILEIFDRHHTSQSIAETILLWMAGAAKARRGEPEPSSGDWLDTAIIGYVSVKQQHRRTTN